MKALISFTFAVALVASLPAMAQNPVPGPDTLQTPIKEGDPALETLPPRLDYVEDRVRITPQELPPPVRQSLESSAQYTDWQKATIYFDRNKEEYLVEFKDVGKTTTYRFDKGGKPIIEEN